MVASVSALFTPDPTKATQYRGVYARRDRPHIGFAAKFKMGSRLRHLGYFPTERDAAVRVAQEFAYWYGPLWGRRFGAGLDERRSNPWQGVRWAAPKPPAAGAAPKPDTVIADDGYVLPAPRPRPPLPRPAAVEGGCPAADAPPGWPVAGWAVTVWEWGQPVVLGDHLHPTDPARDWPHRRRPWVWPTESAAGAAYRAWRREGPRRRWGLLHALSLWR